MNFRGRVMAIDVANISKHEVRCRAAEVAADADAKCNRLLGELANLVGVIEGAGGTSPNAVDTAREAIRSCFRETHIWNGAA